MFWVVDSADTKAALTKLERELYSSIQGLKWVEKTKKLKINRIPATWVEGTGVNARAAQLDVLVVVAGPTSTKKGVIMLAVVEHEKLQANRKTREGASHPDRNSQFEYINASVRKFQGRSQPAISVDTKKKELIGDFKNAGQEWRPRPALLAGSTAAGALGAAATISFLFATREGYLSIASVVTSLYPAFTVVLAATVLREHVHRAQAVGLVMCATAVALVAAG